MEEEMKGKMKGGGEKWRTEAEGWREDGEGRERKADKRQWDSVL